MPACTESLVLLGQLGSAVHFIILFFVWCVDEIAAAENGISSATSVVTEVDDYDHYNITIDRMALSADDSVHVDGLVPPQIFPFRT